MDMGILESSYGPGTLVQKWRRQKESLSLFQTGKDRGYKDKNTRLTHSESHKKEVRPILNVI